jgi:hypothetical protein
MSNIELSGQQQNQAQNIRERTREVLPFLSESLLQQLQGVSTVEAALDLLNPSLPESINPLTQEEMQFLLLARTMQDLDGLSEMNDLNVLSVVGAKRRSRKDGEFNIGVGSFNFTGQFGCA